MILIIYSYPMKKTQNHLYNQEQRNNSINLRKERFNPQKMLRRFNLFCNFVRYKGILFLKFTNMKLIKCTLLAVALFCVPSLSHAQLGDILNKVVNAVTTPSVSANQLEGTWIFTGSAVQLESDNILKKAAGSAISSQAQKKFDNYLKQEIYRFGRQTYAYIRHDGNFIYHNRKRFGR